MKPTVIANANANASASTGSGPNNAPNGITIPINHEYGGPPLPHQQQQSQHPQYHTQAQHFVGAGDPHSTAYGSPGGSSHVRAQQHQQPYPQQQPHPQQQQIPAHFQQDFDFEPDMGMDMFPRSRLGRMAHDPFADFGASRKRSSLHDPQFHSDVFSRYFDDDPDFGFPQFNSLGRRRVNNPHNDDDFFNRLPTEFRQYIPEGFGHRRATAGVPTTPGTPGVHPQQQQQQQQPQQPQPQQMPSHYYQTMPQSPTKKVCDAAIQTEDPNAGRSEVDHAVNTDNLNQHGLRNTMDMGVKSAAENDNAGIRSHSAPPNEPLQQQQMYHPQQQQIPVNGQQRPAPPQQPQSQAGGRPQFGTQTSPQVQTGGYAGQAPQFQKAYYAPHTQSHPQQKQQTPPPPQTPGGSYIRTIPIFVEGRSEPIINNKEIPNQNAAPNTSATGRAFTPPKQQQPPQYPQQQQSQTQPQPQPQPQQQHRPTPLNTQNQQQQQPQQGAGLPPHTPHTVDSINKIQDIQRDVLELMSCVEQFTGTRADKEYAYLDEMLTRNLLKLDNIDTNGKESIRLARKEAIKCIQASINVLEAKAEENTKAAQANAAAAPADAAAAAVQEAGSENPQKSSSGAKVTKEPSQTKVEEQPEEPADANKIQEPIPLPPPEGMVADIKTETTAEATPATGEESKENKLEKEATPTAPENAAAKETETKQANAETTEANADATAVATAAAAAATESK